MVDKGKVLRNVYKKKLAEYVQAKEQKGEQEVHSETVPTTKSPVEKLQRRENYELNFEFKKKDGGVENVLIQANLSVAERKKLVNFAKYINSSIGLSSSALVVERLSNLLKRVITESSGYSADFADAMIELLNALNNNLEVVVKSSKSKEGLQGIRNIINQLIEVFTERKENLYPEEEGISAVGQKGTKKIEVPFEEGAYEEEEEPQASAPSAPAQAPSAPAQAPSAPAVAQPASSASSASASSSGSVVVPAFPNITFGDGNLNYRQKREEGLRQIQKIYNELQFTSTNQATAVRDLIERYASSLRTSPMTSGKIQTFGGEKGVLAELKRKIGETFTANIGKGMGMRKGRHNTHRGYIGYGHQMAMKGCGHEAGHVEFSTVPAVDKGFATAPMNANSPFHQPAYRSKQTNAIPKYLNFNYIPNERGNFAVIED